ncbi:MAG: amidohydrolase family protein [Herpetosiphonaceae bacterium]|nr:amidohydrolase family protein [Herpetosiphonaceae bacterium]
MITSTTTAITNVRLFDGKQLTDKCTVVLENGIISHSTAAPATIDGHGGTLLPGLIDAHVHILSEDDMGQGAQWGVTTMLDMASASTALINAFRHRSGLPDIQSATLPASAPGGMQTTRMGFPTSSIVTGPADAPRFVAERIAEGADYIKVIVENPHSMGSAALDGPTIAALVQAAHKANVKIIAHATSLAALQLAADARVDVITHAPLDAAADDGLIRSIAACGTVAVPTLTMMRAAAGKAAQMPTHQGTVTAYVNARATVSAFHAAGIPIIAGTDANMAAASPMKVSFGESLHDELGLLVEAGLTPVEALQAATAVPAEFFGLTDRGSIAPGRRADLVLVDGNPTHDIRATRAIQGVWAAGVRVR